MKMKLLSLVATFGLCVPMTATEMTATDMCIEQYDGTVVRYNIDCVENVYYEEVGLQVDGHEYVDLGLPSGLKWATMNVGANMEYDYGNYYAWGEVAPAPANNYSEDNCKAYGKTTSELKTSGVLDANGKLTAEYDAATQNWGENWRMPTIEEWEELYDNCTWTKTSLRGVKGFKVASKATGNNNWIFLPAAGYYDGTSRDNEGSDGYYWSPIVYYDIYGAYYHDVCAAMMFTEYNYRHYGRSVRPVYEDVNQVVAHEYVDLGLPSGLKWATMNVGAKKETDYGNYYAWGEVAPAPLYDYSDANCKAYGKPSSELKTSGVLNANGNLNATYDVATQNWGENWRMPTMAEYDELLKNCTWTWTSLDGVDGYKVASKATGNNNWIFLPAAGFCKGTSNEDGWDGYYWSSTVNESNSNSACILFSSMDVGTNFAVTTDYSIRNVGYSVRPVYEANQEEPDGSINQVDGHGYVELGLPSGTKWATMNIGASTKTAYGNKYAWGDVAPAPANEYPQTHNKTSSELKTSGILDTNDNLTAEYDAATVNWGENWRMPTKDEFDELVNNCTWTWTSLRGVLGYKVASNVPGNSNWIFLPSSGNTGSEGSYWSSTVHIKISNAYSLYFKSSSCTTTYNSFRKSGFSVRPVVKE